MKTNDMIIAVMRFMILGLLLALTACSEEWISGNTPTTEGGRVLSVNIDLPDAKPGFSETDLRSTTESSWNNGDELLMELQLLDENSTIKFTEGLTLIYNEGDWTVPATSKLITDETLSLSGNLTLRIPESVTEEVTAKVELYYAPECTWVDNNLALKTTAMTTAPEKWQFEVDSWATSAARLRIHTGVEGDNLRIISTIFATAFDKSEGIYTATTDAQGDAYFYGALETSTTSGFTVSIEVKTTQNDGTEVSAYSTVLEASPLVPLTLTAGKCYLVDFESN